MKYNYHCIGLIVHQAFYLFTYSILNSREIVYNNTTHYDVMHHL